MSYEDWLYRKADQYAHNEILAFIMMVLGMVSLVGGLTVTVVMSGQILLIPILETYPLSPSSSVGFMLTTGGFTVLLAGFVLAVYYDRKRTWHVGEIEKGNHLKNRKIDINVVKKTFEDFSKEEKPVRPSSRQKKRELKENAV